jgi:NAD(P)-dependent dehydrogenase (short-subunit alcohol dehydrogenase family)
MSGATNVVLGAASGMGAAVAARLAARAPLLLADRDGELLTGVAAALAGEVTTMTCDITVSAEIDDLREAAGRLGALVVTAGLSPSMAGGRRIFEVNLVGLERVVRAFRPAVGEGSAAVCFTSIAGHLVTASEAIDAVLDDPLSETFFDDLAAQGLDPDHPQLAYALSKRGVHRLVRRHAAAWGRGARGSCRCPRASSTPAWVGSRRRTSL